MNLEMDLNELISLRDSMKLLNKSKLFEEFLIKERQWIEHQFSHLKEKKEIDFDVKDSHIVFAIKINNVFYESLERIATKKCKI